jgi:hypothetical protein
MSWVRPGLLALPFAVAGVMNVLAVISRWVHLRPDHIAAHMFLFGAPWAWLLDRGWVGSMHSRWADAMVGYAVLLWIPAFLYSGCLRLLMRIFRFPADRVRG